MLSLLRGGRQTICYFTSYLAFILSILRSGITLPTTQEVRFEEPRQGPCTTTSHMSLCLFDEIAVFMSIIIVNGSPADRDQLLHIKKAVRTAVLFVRKIFSQICFCWHNREKTPQELMNRFHYLHCDLHYSFRIVCPP